MDYNMKGPGADKRLLVNRDRMNSVSRLAVATAMVNAFDRIQAQPREVQLMALAGAFCLMSEVTGIEPQEAYTAVKNLMVDPKTSTRRELRFQAMAFHLATELLKAQR